MMEKFIHFIKYNNVTILIIAVIFVAGTSVFASEAGQEAIGKKQTSVEGVDNTLLLAVDLDKFDMEFKVEKIEADEKMYYITYTYLDLVEENNVWQYQLKENIRRISKKSGQDMGVYLAEELKEEYDNRLEELKQAQAEARASGEEKRIVVTEYSGLIGASLDLVAKVFSNYEPIKREEIKSPVPEESLLQLKNSVSQEDGETSGADDLTQIYQNYVSENDPDGDDIFALNDNCPVVSNPDQLDSNVNGVGDACETAADEDAQNTEVDKTTELAPTTADNLNNEGEELRVEIIDLPVQETKDEEKVEVEPIAEEPATSDQGRGSEPAPAEIPAE